MKVARLPCLVRFGVLTWGSKPNRTGKKEKPLTNQRLAGFVAETAGVEALTPL